MDVVWRFEANQFVYFFFFIQFVYFLCPLGLLFLFTLREMDCEKLSIKRFDEIASHLLDPTFGSSCLIIDIKFIAKLTYFKFL